MGSLSLGAVVGYEIVAQNSAKEGCEAAKSDFLTMFHEVTTAAASVIFIFDQVMAYGRKFIDLANAAAEYNHQMEISSIITGMSAEEMMKWNRVATMAETDVSTITMTIARLSNNLNDNTAKGKENQALLRSWGIEVKNADGSFKNMSETFPLIIDHIRNMSDKTQANIYAQALFSRGFMQLAPLFALTGKEMKTYYDQAGTLSKDEQSNLDRYEKQLRNLDADFAALERRIGIGLVGSLTHAAWAMDQFVTHHQSGFDKFFSFMDDRLNETIFLFEYVAEMLSVGWELDPFKVSAHMKNWVENWKLDYKSMIETVKEETDKTTEPPFEYAAEEKALTQSEILQKQNRLAVLGWDIKNAQTEYNKLLNAADKTQSDYNEKLDRARLKLQGLVQDAADLTAELQKAGTAAAGMAGPTYATTFASTLPAGGIGPDWAGYNELINMSEEQLEVIAKGGAGKSKGMQEKAQMYLDMMKAAPTTAGTTTLKKVAQTPEKVAQDQMKIITESYVTQATAFDTLVTKTITQYQKWETAAVTHYTALSEISRLYMEKLVNDWFKAADLITSKIAYMQTITVRNGVQAAAPIIASPSPTFALPAFDSSGVKMLTGGTTVVVEKGAVQVNNDNRGNPNADKISSKTADQVNTALGTLAEQYGPAI